MVVTGQRQRFVYMIVGALGNNRDKAISQNGWLRPLEAWLSSAEVKVAVAVVEVKQSWPCAQAVQSICNN
jgi:hypothetical protein